MHHPNFLLFITDQQRADHLGAYDNATVHTPHIDALARDGWMARRCYVASPICMPNRASLLTGRLPSVHGARHNGIPLPFSEVTFTERLRDAGYTTALIGKAHLQNISGNAPVWPPASQPPTRGEARRPEPGRFNQEWGPSWDAEPDFEMDLPFYGFEQVRLVINHGDTAGGHYRRWLRQEYPDVAARTGPKHALPTPDYVLSQFQQAWRTQVPEELSTTSYVGVQTCKILSDMAAGDKPFFLQCSFPDPHHPFTPPGRFWGMYDPDEMPLPPSFHAPVRGRVPHRAWIHAQRDKGRAVKNTPAMFGATEREVREALALNYGSISHIDETVGKVMAHLHQLRLADNTVVMFTSDHGDYLGDHQLLWKGPMHYQGVTRVPFIWRDPKQTKPGASSQLCSTIDIAPTVLARAGCVPHNGIQGLSLLPTIAADAPLDRDALLIEEEGQRTMFGFAERTRMRTLQTGRYRLSVYAGADWGELYDIAQDPGESHNLWDDGEHGALRHQLLHQLAQTMIHYTDTSPHPTALA